MKKTKRGFTLVEVMAVIAILIIVLPIIFNVFIQGYKIVTRTENKTTIQNDFRNIIINIEKDMENVKLTDTRGYSQVGESVIDTSTKIKYEGKEYDGRYIIDIITMKKAYFEVNVDGKKQLWICNYSRVDTNSSGNFEYIVDGGEVEILISNMDISTSIVARNNNGIIVFNMDESGVFSEYYGGVKMSEDSDITIGITSESNSGSGIGSRQPILLANSVDGIVKIKSTNKEIVFDSKKLESYYVIDSKRYISELSDGFYGKLENKGDGIQIPNFNFEKVNNISLENIDGDLYFDKNEGGKIKKVKVTNIGESSDVKELGDGIRYFMIGSYNVYLFNANKLTIKNSNTNNLRWNKLELTDTVIICSGDIDILNESYCTTNLSGSMIAGRNIYLENDGGTLIMYSESEKRLRISESTINKIKSVVSLYSTK